MGIRKVNVNVNLCYKIYTYYFDFIRYFCSFVLRQT